MRAKVINLLLLALFGALLPVQAHAAKPLNQTPIATEQGKFLQSSIQVFGKDLNNK
jgi:hypothetical protein